MEGSAEEKNTVEQEGRVIESEGDRRGHWAETRRKLGVPCWVWWTKAPGQGTQASSGEGGPCSWTAESREPVVEIGSESDWHSLVSCGHLLAPRGGALVEDTGHAFVHNLSVPHAWWNRADKDAKLTYILAQGRQFPVLWNLHKTQCPYFVLVWGRKWV